MEKSEEIVEEISQNVEQLEEKREIERIKMGGGIWKWKYQLQRPKTWARGVIGHKIIKEIIKENFPELRGMKPERQRHCWVPRRVIRGDTCLSPSLWESREPGVKRGLRSFRREYKSPRIRNQVAFISEQQPQMLEYDEEVPLVFRWNPF